FVSDISTPGRSLCRNKGTASLYVADAVWSPWAEPLGLAVVVVAAVDGDLRLRPARRRRARMMKALAILVAGRDGVAWRRVAWGDWRFNVASLRP
ncbi:hypothetical protein GW17_00059782, partial [Ensete ventricosum]